MMGKILSGQFQKIFQEFMGNESITSFHKTKEVNQWMKFILKIDDNSVLQNLQINNRRKTSFHNFCNVTKKTIEANQEAAVDDHKHDNATAESNVDFNMRFL